MKAPSVQKRSASGVVYRVDGTLVLATHALLPCVKPAEILSLY